MTLLVSGSEVEIAMAAAETLAKEAINAAVVSMPSWELFERQQDSYQREVLGEAPRVSVEAALRFGWDRWIGERGVFAGMNGFGASAPAPDLYRHFGQYGGGRRRRREICHGLTFAPTKGRSN